MIFCVSVGKYQWDKSLELIYLINRWRYNVFNSSSAAKRERQNEKARLRNRETKSAVRTAIKKFQTAASSNDTSSVKEKFDSAIKLLDTAGSKGIYHANTVSRKKSRLQTQFNAMDKA